MTPTIPTIYEGMCRHDAEQSPRGYLGMSSIGSPCTRQSWYAWRQTTGSITDGRVLLLFETGKHVEMIVCRALRLAGFVLEGAYPDQQLSYSDHGGFFSGHPDGIAEDESGKMIIEIKSSNTNKFKAFSEKGVREVYPAYYAQMQLYMGYSGLPRALFLVMKKDDSSLYEETVTFEEAEFKRLKTLASRIIRTHEDDGRIAIPERISSDQKSDECNWCRYKIACHEPREAIQKVLSCRSCAYLRIGDDFKPVCGHRDHVFPLKDISKACPQWTWVNRCPF